MEKDNVSMLAKARIEYAVSKLKRTYSEFLYPLNRIMFKENKQCLNGQGDRIYTDGMCIYYSAAFVATWREELLEYWIMHVVVHGMLGHFLIKDDFTQKKYRDALMDAQVTYVLKETGIYNGTCDYYLANAPQDFAGNFSMEQYYRACSNRKLAENLIHAGRAFKVDEHRCWDIQEDKDSLSHFWNEILECFYGEEERERNADRIGRMQRSLRSYGTSTIEEEKNFAITERKTRDYREILQNLMGICEAPKEDPDSIDPMFYHYGMSLFGNTPLLEPLENSCKKVLHTLVLAVDVSGSCATEACMDRLWGETYQCIRQIEEPAGEGEILLIQCDTKIQSEKSIPVSDFCETPEHIIVRGMGGTSFLPVFERADELSQKGKIIDAVFYFTDGAGEYPKKKPDYPVYFVMEEKDWKDCEDSQWMPDWIEKVCI